MSETTNTSQEKQAATETAMDSEEPAYPGLVATGIIVLGLSLAVFLMALDQTTVGLAVPAITNQFSQYPDPGHCLPAVCSAIGLCILGWPLLCIYSVELYMGQ